MTVFANIYEHLGFQVTDGKDYENGKLRCICRLSVQTGALCVTMRPVLDSNQAGSTNLQTAPFKRSFIFIYNMYKPQQLGMILINVWPNAPRSKSKWIKWERFSILSRVIRGKEKLNRICGILVWDLQTKDLGEWRCTRCSILWNHLQNLCRGLRVLGG